jgi:hypothetical protein
MMAIDNSSGYGKRLIPQILDRLGALDPDRIVYSIAGFSADSPQFRHISARDFAKAVDKTAWWLYNQVGAQNELRSKETNGTQHGHDQRPPQIQPLGYIGPRKSNF